MVRTSNVGVGAWTKQERSRPGSAYSGGFCRHPWEGEQVDAVRHLDDRKQSARLTGRRLVNGCAYGLSVASEPDALACCLPRRPPDGHAVDHDVVRLSGVEGLSNGHGDGAWRQNS